VAGDRACGMLMERARQAFAVACVGWVNAFNPVLIVVGGTLAERQGERWLGTARAAVESSAFRAPAARVRIVPAQLGDDVGLVGAWPLVAQRRGDPTWREKRPGHSPGKDPAARAPQPTAPSLPPGPTEPSTCPAASSRDSIPRCTNASEAAWLSRPPSLRHAAALSRSQSGHRPTRTARRVIERSAS